MKTSILAEVFTGGQYVSRFGIVVEHIRVAQGQAMTKPAGTTPQTQSNIRFITATSLFDGHDAAINIMRRLLQSEGAEVIHLGHNRSVDDIVTAAIQEDVHGIAVTCYQGGHLEFFKYMVDALKDAGRADIRIVGGGGGVIIPAEIEQLEAYGVEKIYSPQDGQSLGLKGMIKDVIKRCSHQLAAEKGYHLDDLLSHKHLSRCLTLIEHGQLDSDFRDQCQSLADSKTDIPVFGITGTGGAGKSSVTDELLRLFYRDIPDIKIAILAIDPSKRKTGGALLGDRIRMNTIIDNNVYMRSLATHHGQGAIPSGLDGMIALCKAADFDLIVVETPGIGQGDSDVVSHVDASLYVMTPEFGAPTQLEKIDMLDFADLVAINKYDRRGAADALRDVSKQMQRNREAFDQSPDDMPVFGTIASRFNDQGVLALYHGILANFQSQNKGNWSSSLKQPAQKIPEAVDAILPSERQRYLAEIAHTVRAFHTRVEQQAQIARERQQITATYSMLLDDNLVKNALTTLITEKNKGLEQESQHLLEEWPTIKEAYLSDSLETPVRDKVVSNTLYHQSLSGLKIPKVALPNYKDDGQLLEWRLKENLPGHFPFTAGVFPFRREGEDPTRMFAGEGDPFRTNQRFKLLSAGSEAKRLSTAFDSVTLYGANPDLRPDIYGKVGNSGVSIATLDDMKALYDGFDLCAPSTSVSMTINGPAPAILAMFFNTAIEQQIAQFQTANGRMPTETEREEIKTNALQQVRGTVQADILKEDQGQNTCIFSTEFSLKMMADIQAYFVKQKVRNFYSVSISGYHIAEAGANPISQLAFTLANGFTYVETYLARGIDINEFAPNLSFFFSNGMDPEYSVMGRVARRIWAVAMRDKYGANARSQKLKYHIQTSGRSLHAQEMHFNDIRTTLEALIAYYDNCNSLHTNAYDEAITTPTEDSLRRALAIQLIISKEWGLSMNHNPNQGSFIIEQLTDMVEEAVLAEFDSISERGGVLGAMETGYQRGKIQEESLHYEHLKHQGVIPIVGVNTFVKEADEEEQTPLQLQRSTEEEKQSQIERLNAFHETHKESVDDMIVRFQQTIENNGNLFEVLMDAVRCMSLGQISDIFYELGGQYRRNM